MRARAMQTINLSRRRRGAPQSLLSPTPHTHASTLSSLSHTMISPAQLPDASATDLSPLLGALLEALPVPLARLVEQSSVAMSDLAHAERPTSYEGLLDVARFCIDEDPGWTDAQRAELLGGHPRIGEKKGVSTTSALEQANAGGDEEQSRKTDERELYD